MRMVIDSNFLQDDKLKEYLCLRTSNFVILSDYLGMESYKGNSHKAIVKKYRILSEYPRQVIVLKNTRLISQNVGRTSGLTQRMFSNEQTNGFEIFCRALKSLEQGDHEIERIVKKRSLIASQHFKKLQEDSSTILQGLIEAEKIFNHDELREIRKEENFSPEIIKKIFAYIVSIEIALRKKVGGIRKPDSKSIHNTYLFRVSLAMVIYIIFWIQKGSQKHIALKRIRNDFVDITFAVYATYFDGLLSNDKNLIEIYNQLDGAINIIAKNACKPRL